jgi:hypothetical protein
MNGAGAWLIAGIYLRPVALNSPFRVNSALKDIR